MGDSFLLFNVLQRNSWAGFGPNTEGANIKLLFIFKHDPGPTAYDQRPTHPRDLASPASIKKGRRINLLGHGMLGELAVSYSPNKTGRDSHIKQRVGSS